MKRLLVVLLTCAPLFGQVDNSLSALTVPEFYQLVLERAGKQGMPQGGPSSVIISRLAETGQKETASTIPFISSALEQSDPVARSYAILGFLTIAGRADGSQLLAPRLELIMKHLNDPEPAIDTLSVGVLSALKEPLPAEIAPLLRQFLSSAKAHGSAGVAVVRLLLKSLPNDSENQKAILAFLVASDEESQGRVIEAFGTAKVQNDQYIDAIIAHLANGSPPFVERASINAIDVLGDSVYFEALPQVQFLADKSDSEEVRHDARQLIAKHTKK